MINPADETIVNLIENLAIEVSHCTFSTDDSKKQTLITQIAELRASMNPVIHQYINN